MPPPTSLNTKNQAQELVLYDAFGNPVSTGTVQNPFTFTGREYDPKSGIYFYRARYYDPGAGRFLSEDPIFALNPYPYAGNDPVNYVDPSGADDFKEDAILIQQQSETLTSIDNWFSFYTKAVEDLDVSTGPNQAVFYSGPGNRALAEEFAQQNGKLTLEQTPGGQWLDAQKLFTSGKLTDEQALVVWGRLSERFAQQASGTAVGFVQGASETSIFNTTEYPALLENPNIVNIITGGW